MQVSVPRSPVEHAHLSLLAASIAHVFDYLVTGSTRAALRAQLLLDRLDTTSTPDDQTTASILQLRRVVAQGERKPCRETR